MNMADAAVDRSVSEQVRDIIFDAIKSIRKTSKRPDTISIIEYITRNPTHFEEAELRDSISKLSNGRILINKKSKQDLNSRFVNEGASTDNAPQGHNNTLPDITLVKIETPNFTLVETSSKCDSDKYNNFKGEVNNNTVNFASGSGLFENLKEEIKFLRKEVSCKSLIIKILAENINNHENLKSNSSLYNDFTCGKKNTKSKIFNNNLSNTPEIDFNIRNKFVKDNDARSNKANFEL